MGHVIQPLGLLSPGLTGEEVCLSWYTITEHTTHTVHYRITQTGPQRNKGNSHKSDQHFVLNCFDYCTNGLAEDCGNSIANAMGLPQSCAKPLIGSFELYHSYKLWRQWAFLLVTAVKERTLLPCIFVVWLKFALAQWSQIEKRQAVKSIPHDIIRYG